MEWRPRSILPRETRFAHVAMNFRLVAISVPFVSPTLAQVASVPVKGGAAQRSRVTELAVVFSQRVTLPSDPRLAFRLTRAGPGTPAGDVALAVDLSASTPAGTVARLTFADRKSVV